MAAARWVLWVALAEAEHGAEWVHASPREVARSYCGRAVGQRTRLVREGDQVTAVTEAMAHHGMSEAALGALRELVLERGWLRVSKAGGKYRSVYSTEHHAWPQDLVRRMVFEYSSRELRAALGMAPSLSAAADAERQGRHSGQVRAVARACSLRTGQGPSRWADAVCGLRARGDLKDNRPTRVLVCGPDGWRYEARTVRTSSRLCPLAPGEAVYRHERGHFRGSDEDGHSKMDTDQLFLSSTKRESSAHELSAEGTAPADTSAGSIAMDETTPDEAPEAAASPEGESGAAPRTDAGLRVTASAEGLARVRAILADELGGVRASDRTCRQIAAACGTVDVLRRVIAVKRPALDALDEPRARAAYLGQVCEGEGEAVRDPRWGRREPRPGRREAPGVEAPRPEELRAARAVEAAGRPSRLVVQALRDVGDEAAARVVAARVEAAEAEARAAAEWAEAERVPQTWAAVLPRLGASAYDLRSWLAPLRALRCDETRRHLVIIAPDETHAELVDEQWGAALRAALGWSVQIRAAGEVYTPGPAEGRTPAERLAAWLDRTGLGRRPGSC